MSRPVEFHVYILHVKFKSSRITGKAINAGIVAGELSVEGGRHSPSSVEGELADDGGLRPQFAPVFVGQTASVLQGVAGCCSVLQGVAECCRVLQSVAGHIFRARARQR